MVRGIGVVMLVWLIAVVGCAKNPLIRPPTR